MSCREGGESRAHFIRQRNSNLSTHALLCGLRRGQTTVNIDTSVIERKSLQQLSTLLKAFVFVMCHALDNVSLNAL